MAGTKAKTQTKPKEYELDVSSNLYPALMTKKSNAVFNISATLKCDVQPAYLKQAVHDLKDRFPTYYVQLKKEFFRYKLIAAEDTDVVTGEGESPLRPVPVGNTRKPMFRVMYAQNRISLEIFHVITDGWGAFLFLKNILARYLELQGCRVERTDGIVELNEAPKATEIEDSFNKLYEAGLERVSRAEPAAYKYEPVFKENYLRITNGLIPVDALKKAAKAQGATVTAYLTALYIYAFYKDMLPDISKNPIKISVPIELRRLFNTETVRNFSLYTYIAFCPERNNHTFDEILAQTVSGLISGTQKDRLKRLASTNAADLNSLGFRILPRVIKNIILKTGYKLFASKIITTTFSNCGVITVPEGMQPYISHFGFTLGSGKKVMLNLSAATFGNVLNLSFASASEATGVQDIFFGFLAEQGIQAEIQTNIYTKSPLKR